AGHGARWGVFHACFRSWFTDADGVSGRNLLATLLHVRADEVLGVLLEHVVDLVEDRVDVLAELLPALLTGRRAAVDIVVAVTAALPLRLLLGHVASRIGIVCHQVTDRD